MVDRENFIGNYEDEYGGQRFSSLEDLLTDLEFWTTPGTFYADINIPIWVNYAEEDQYNNGEVIFSRLSIGIFMPRHGTCNIKYVTSVGPEAVKLIQNIIMRHWIWRAEMGFQRYSPIREEVTVS